MFKDIFNTSVNIREKMNYVVLAAAIAANALGVAANMIMLGFEFSTAVFGICLLLIIAIYAVCEKTGRISLGAKITLTIVIFAEFPLLYYVYGGGTAIYMLLGLFGIGMIFERRLRIYLFYAALIYDCAVMAAKYFFPYNAQLTDNESVISYVLSFIVVACAMFTIIILFIKQYEKQNAELAAAAAELKETSNYDPLVHIYNRRYLTEYIENLSKAETPEYYIVLIDLDDISRINQKYGHIYGDKVIVEFGRILKNVLGDRGIAARFSGGHFMIVYESTDMQKLKDILDDVRKEYRAFSMSDVNEVFTFTGAVEQYSEYAEITEFYNRADEKLRRAKDNGRNVVVFT